MIAPTSPIKHVVMIVKENHVYDATFGLPSLNARTRTDDGMADCFDFTQAPLPPPA
ncbi:MAG TPA: hypothetical protein VLU92_07025 [Candidatus Dormibacteraeota bacterium]|nr:hypothetical protein [Candidatus Dormibacteraeota bacterium]